MRALNEEDNKLCYEFLREYRGDPDRDTFHSSLYSGLASAEKYLFGKETNSEWLDTYHPEFDYCEAIVHIRYDFYNEAEKPTWADFNEDYSRESNIDAEGGRFADAIDEFSMKKLGDYSLDKYYCESRPDLYEDYSWFGRYR